MPHSKAGFVLIMTKYAGLEGTCRLITENRNELLKRFSPSFLDSALNLKDLSSDEKDRRIAERCRDTDIYEAGENGIFAAFWEFAEETGLGLSVDLRRIPVRQETIEISNHLDVNPYEISSTGILLISAEKSRVDDIIRELRENGINADVIGEFNNGNDRVLINREAKRFLTPVRRIEDEIKLRKSQKNGKGA